MSIDKYHGPTANYTLSREKGELNNYWSSGQHQNVYIFIQACRVTCGGKDDKAGFLIHTFRLAGALCPGLIPSLAVLKNLHFSSVWAWAMSLSPTM